MCNEIISNNFTIKRQEINTRKPIIKAAIGVYSEMEFRSASTRLIAVRVVVNQGLLTYHLKIGVREDLFSPLYNMETEHPFQPNESITSRILFAISIKASSIFSH